MTEIRNYLKHRGQLLICLSGVSGAGKTHNAKIIAQMLGLQFIDQDDFFKPIRQLPICHLSNGSEMRNWDCIEALDTDTMNATIAKSISTGVIFAGFACRDSIFENTIDLQIHLKINEKICYQRRQETERDEFENPNSKLYVEEFVYPFYLETIKQSRIDKIFDTSQKSKENLSIIIDEIECFLKRSSPTKLL